MRRRPRPYRPEVEALAGRRAPSLTLGQVAPIPAPTPILPPPAPAPFASGLGGHIAQPGGDPALLGD